MTSATYTLPTADTAVKIATDTKYHSMMDLMGSVLYFAGSSHSKIFSTMADANYLKYAVGDLGALYFQMKAAIRDGGEHLYGYGRLISVHTGNLVSNCSDGWKFLVTCRLVSAWSGLAIAGGVLGIYSKAVESYDLYNQNIVALADKKDVVKAGRVISEDHRTAQLAFKISIIAIKIMSLATLLYAVSIGATAFTVVGTVISLSDLGAAYIESQVRAKIKTV